MGRLLTKITWLKARLRSSRVCSENVTQSVVPGLAVAADPGNLLELKILGHLPRPVLSQKLWEWDQAVCVVISFGGDRCTLRFVQE